MASVKDGAYEDAKVVILWGLIGLGTKCGMRGPGATRIVAAMC